MPLFEYLQFPEKIEFDDEIILTITKFIEKSKRISPVMERLFQVFPKYFKKHKSTLRDNLFKCLIGFLRYGTIFFKTS